MINQGLNTKINNVKPAVDQRAINKKAKSDISFSDVLRNTSENTSENTESNVNVNESLTDDAVIRVPIDKILSRDKEYIFIQQNAINANLINAMKNSENKDSTNKVKEAKTKDTISKEKVEEVLIELMNGISSMLMENGQLLEDIASKMGIDKNQIFSAIITEFKVNITETLEKSINFALSQNKNSKFSEKSDVLQYFKEGSIVNMDNKDIKKMFEGTVNTFIKDLQRNVAIGGKNSENIIRDTMKLTFNNENRLNKLNMYMQDLKVNVKNNSNVVRNIEGSDLKEHSNFLNSRQALASVKDKSNELDVTGKDVEGQVSFDTVMNKENLNANKIKPKDIYKYKDSVVEQVKDNVIKNSIDGKKEFAMQLNPQGLGKLLVRFSTNAENEVIVNIFTQSDEIRKLLSNELHNLKNDMKYLGDISIKVEKSDNADTEHFGSGFNGEFTDKNYKGNENNGTRRNRTYLNDDVEMSGMDLMEETETRANIVRNNMLMDAYI